MDYLMIFNWCFSLFLVAAASYGYGFKRGSDCAFKFIRKRNEIVMSAIDNIMAEQTEGNEREVDHVH